MYAEVQLIMCQRLSSNLTLCGFHCMLDVEALQEEISIFYMKYMTVLARLNVLYYFDLSVMNDILCVFY